MFSSLLRSMQRLRLPSSIKLFAIFLSIFLLVQPIVAKKFPESIILEEDDKSLDGSNSESAAIDSNQNIPDDRILNRSKPRNECEGKHNEAVKTLMEKVCELCHDFFSHHNPNTRSQCRFVSFNHLLKLSLT